MIATNTHSQSGEISPETTKRYAYRPLESAEHIRLLHLLPALQSGQPLVCSIRQKHLPDAIASYEAVSYTWGIPDFSCKLRCADEDSELDITKNADTLLRRFRDEHRTRVLWIDAVCINQADNEEKGTQIPLMGQIYRFASKVLAWLGEGGIEEGAIPLVQRISRKAPTDYERLTALPSTSFESGFLQLMDSERPRPHAVLKSFFDLPWFRRRWIIQEIVLNAESYLYYGQDQISWFRFMSTVKDIADKDPSKDLSTQIGPTSRVFNLWRDWCFLSVRNDTFPGRVRDEDSLLSYLGAFDEYKCSDPKDRIYALSALAGISRSSRLAEIAFEHDYSQSTEQCYTSFAASAICRGHVSQTLQQAVGRNYGSSGLDIPSWAPNWLIPYRDFLGRQAKWKSHHFPGVAFKVITGHALTVVVESRPLNFFAADPNVYETFATITSQIFIPEKLDQINTNGAVKRFLDRGLGVATATSLVFLNDTNSSAACEDAYRPRQNTCFSLTGFSYQSMPRSYLAMPDGTVGSVKVNSQTYPRWPSYRNVYEAINRLDNQAERTIFLTGVLKKGTSPPGHVKRANTTKVEIRYLGWGNVKFEPGDKIVGLTRHGDQSSALVVRPMHDPKGDQGQSPQYRLVGISAVIAIAISMEDITREAFPTLIGRLLVLAKAQRQRNDRYRDWDAPSKVEIQLV
jgi:hypothetical protein